MLYIWERKEKITSQRKKITNSFCRCQKWRPVQAERPNVAGEIFGFCHWNGTITIVIQLLQTAHNHLFLITLPDYLFGYPVPSDITDRILSMLELCSQLQSGYCDNPIFSYICSSPWSDFCTFDPRSSLISLHILTKQSLTAYSNFLFCFLHLDAGRGFTWSSPGHSLQEGVHKSPPGRRNLRIHLFRASSIARTFLQTPPPASSSSSSDN